MAKADPHTSRYGKARERRESSSASGKCGRSSAAARPQSRNAASAAGSAPQENGVATSCFTPQMRETLDIWNRPFGNDKRKKAGPPARLFSRKPAEEGNIPRFFGYLAILAFISLGWAGWTAFSAMMARDEERLAEWSRSDDAEESGGGAAGPSSFYGVGVGRSPSAAGAVSSGVRFPARQRANITARGGSFRGLGIGS